MSHQPSTTDNIQSTTNSAYEFVVNTITPSNSKTNSNTNNYPNQDKANFKKDAYGNTVKKGDFKDQLNDAASGVPKEPEPTYIQQVISSVPGINKLQQMAYDQGEPPKKDERPPGPPERPEHDVQVEEFLRRQYCSKIGDGMPDLDWK